MQELSRRKEEAPASIRGNCQLRFAGQAPATVSTHLQLRAAGEHLLETDTDTLDDGKKKRATNGTVSGGLKNQVSDG